MKNILVTGDFLVDHHIYQGKRHHFGDQGNPGVCVKEELGGAALIHRLLEALGEGSEPRWKSSLAIDEVDALETTDTCDPDDPHCKDQPYSAYAFWEPYPVGGRSTERCWRVSKAMGFGGGAAKPGLWPWKPSAQAVSRPDVLVISDGGMGFRSRRNAPHWGFSIQDQKMRDLLGDQVGVLPSGEEPPSWIILKMSAPAAQGDLWRELSTFHKERLVVIVSATELRRANVRIGASLSWEQTLEDLHEALAHSPDMHALTGCRHLIIPFGSAGALWLDNKGEGNLTANFVFDPEHVEGERRHQVKGDVYGYLSCLTASVAAAFASDDGTGLPDLVPALRAGLHAMRHLRTHGHGHASESGAGFPASSIAEALRKGNADSSLGVASFQCDDDNCPVRPGWSLLALNEVTSPEVKTIPLHGIARRVLIRGPQLLEAPTLKVGGFFTADRGEIEALRSLRQLVRRYLNNRKADKPLSIGVFGPPGAGKSFAVKQLAKNLLGDELGWLEFNLSQFDGAADLIGALHQVRDMILKGKKPVAFFDEFDSQDFKWLRSLLAPMQDGAFQEGQVSHPVGQCLFIFAGGTSATFEEFADKGEPDKQPKDKSEAAKDFCLSKGPDFASRLDGKLNVVGPNPRKDRDGIVMPEDIFYPVRRALFIRAVLGCSAEERLQIDPGLAAALLEIPEFSHGSRSLCKLLEPFIGIRRQEKGTRLRLSDLLPPDQLRLHVSLKEFNELTERDAMAAGKLGVEELARAIHTFYEELGILEGWLKEEGRCAFDDLSLFLKASNIEAARRVPANLSLAGLKLVEGAANEEELETANAIIESNIELLAEAEHDGWMDWHLANGWNLAEPRNNALQEHPLLKPYSDLDKEGKKEGEEPDKEKDRNAIRYYPKIVTMVGMKIVRKKPNEANGD